MEQKKTPKANLQGKRGLFFQIGLVVSLCAMIAFMSIGKSEKQITKIDMQLAPVEMDLTDVTRHPQDAPKDVVPKAPVYADIINIVGKDHKINTELGFFPENGDIPEIVKIPRKETPIIDDEPYVAVEKMPQFEGGDLETFRRWVQGRLKYPSDALDNNISGKVTLRFVVEKDGTVSSIEILQTPDKSLSDESVRVLSQSPRWTPGRQQNVPARVQLTLPVEFRLSN